jgi:ATP-dependent RNA helicase RhlE
MELLEMPEKSFADFALLEPIQRAVTEAGYETPTPIQAQAIPLIKEGRDVLGCAQTGTGKTAAFALPILHRLAQQKRHLERRQVRVLVLAPTRELAVQIHESFRTYGRFLRPKTAMVFGGVSQGPQVRAVSAGVDVLVATPGRLLDLLQQRQADLSRLETFVLDEADRMLDMGFINDIRKIMAYLPAKRHTLLFSATMPNEIRKLADQLLVNPAMVEVVRQATTAAKIAQSVMFVDRANKRPLLQHILAQKHVDRVIVFTRTKHGANRVVDQLSDTGIRSDAIHGNKSQNARQRALNSFRAGHLRVLVATDVMARGIDIDDVTHVINYDIPNESESYVHRIGRTGRAGNSGFAISFCDPQERGFLRDIEKLIGLQIPIELEHPFHSEAALQSRDSSQSLRYGGNTSGGNKKRGGGGGAGGFKRPKPSKGKPRLHGHR